MQYKTAPEVEMVGRELVNEYHPELRNVRVEYVFGEKVGSSGGRAVWGRARKKTGLDAFFAADYQPTTFEEEPAPFFVIEIAEPIWQDLSNEGRRALVDHELMHCGVDADTGKLTIRPHYIEEFPQIIRRHGLWKGDVEVFARASAEQLELQVQEQREENEELHDAADEVVNDPARPDLSLVE